MSLFFFFRPIELPRGGIPIERIKRKREKDLEKKQEEEQRQLKKKQEEELLLLLKLI